jgi:uncharacterized DUF497 family protein
MDESFEWDEAKNRENWAKHGVSFEQAQYAFADTNRLIFEDGAHSTTEEIRFFCIGRVENRILTVRFTYRESGIRIFGAGYWRKYRRLYLVRSKSQKV